MDNKTGESILEKHGLGGLENKPVSRWSEADFEAVLNACRIENMSPRLPLLFNPSNIDRLLLKSNCMGCGRCCGHAPDNTGVAGPGVFLFEDELKKLSRHSDNPWKQLKKKVTKHESVPGAWYLPFPCIFRRRDKCQAYEARPFACRTFPLSNYQLNGKYYIAVNVQCRYGGEIYKSVLKELSAEQAGGKQIRYET
jgi:Fe-S-cluster containining protein